MLNVRHIHFVYNLQLAVPVEWHNWDEYYPEMVG